MSETETTEAFLKRMANTFEEHWSRPDVHRLLSLARRGASIPDEPTEAMLKGARDWSVKKYGMGVGNDGASGCWKAMLSIALKESSQPSEVNIHEWTERRRY
jgi:hypothetical protein